MQLDQRVSYCQQGNCHGVEKTDFLTHFDAVGPQCAFTMSRLVLNGPAKTHIRSRCVTSVWNRRPIPRKSLTECGAIESALLRVQPNGSPSDHLYDGPE